MCMFIIYGCICSFEGQSCLCPRSYGSTTQLLIYIPLVCIYFFHCLHRFFSFSNLDNV
ncbi:hypothetical protein HanIR_Chr06g0266551 [Helianthus annuus]|nr:hypothetical protein HanIR_Chr06g0266551 [Helianthus annuus]